MKRNDGKKAAKSEDFLRLKKKRKMARIRLRELGIALGYSSEWPRLAENGRLPLSVETVKKIDHVIDELARLRDQMKKVETEVREKVFADAKLRLTCREK